MMVDCLRALIGGALAGLALAAALLIHGRITGVCGTLNRVHRNDDGANYRRGFLVGLFGTGMILGLIWPGAYGTAVRGIPLLAVAGLLVGIGTTLANGCTSGHAVCGVARFSKRSIVATCTFFGFAAITVFILGARS